MSENREISIKERLMAAENAGKQGRSHQAELLYIQAVEIATLTLGSKDPELATVLIYLADFYAARGQYSKAEPFYRQVLGIYTENFGSNSVITAACMHSLGEVCENQGMVEEAQALKNQAQRRLAYR